MKRVVKRAVLLVMGLLWLIAAALGLEVYGKRVDQRIEDRYQALNATSQDAVDLGETGKRIRAEFGEPLPPNLRRELPGREQFFTLDEAGRSALAQQRQELAMVCDREGTLLSAYPAGEPAELAELSARAHPGASLQALLPEEPWRDAREALARVCDTQSPWAPDYPIPMANGNKYVFQFHFLPEPIAGQKTARAWVFAQPSIWDELWFSFKKNIDSSDGFYFAKVEQFRTNNLGFRANDLALPKPPGVFRIVCIGASTTAEGPTNALTYPNILEKKLRKHFGGRPIEVVNCGIYGIESSQEKRHLPDYLALQPDLIIYYDMINDIRTDSCQWRNPEKGKPGYFMKRFKSWLRESRFLFNEFNPWLLPGDDEIRADMERNSLANIREIAAAAKEAGAAMVLCSFAAPDLAHCRPDEADYFERTGRGFGLTVINAKSYVHIARIFNERVKRLCAEEGMLYAPVAEGLQGGIIYFNDCCHMNLAGIEKKADILFNTLKAPIAAKWAPAAPAP